VVFEIQQNSDVTFRLYDWGHVDAKTGKLRELQVDQAMDCIDFAEGPVDRVTPVLESATPVKREQIFDCEYFRLCRIAGGSPFSVGAMDLPRVLVCIEGGGEIKQGYASYAVGKGDVLFLPCLLYTSTVFMHGNFKCDFSLPFRVGPLLTLHLTPHRRVLPRRVCSCSARKRIGPFPETSNTASDRRPHIPRPRLVD